MFFTKWAGTPTWTPLYSGLSSKDAGDVTAQLDSQGIKYKVSGFWRTYTLTTYVSSFS